ncbi:hypothetical protein HPB49_016582 [Dermacentor silvarum]|uniref:Uncharacterized protein n=1 Tax=Dermacentor silvarum TaxID=543639 RepID=A0ACB8CAF1_DERSI|nr:hypothetical protein HPB49_016582 [Dermacentor silvarum]
MDKLRKGTPQAPPQNAAEVTKNHPAMNERRPTGTNGAHAQVILQPPWAPLRQRSPPPRPKPQVPEPDYRQLLVEALMMISLAVENDTVANFKMPIDVESIVQHANGLFLDDQRSCQGNATLCCTSPRGDMACQSSVGIYEHFYDSAPSGTYGTMTYLMRAVAYTLPDVNISLDCMPS